jgi:hypothetical protein
LSAVLVVIATRTADKARFGPLARPRPHQVRCAKNLESACQSGLGGRSGGDANIEDFTERRWLTVNTEPAHYPY